MQRLRLPLSMLCAALIASLLSLGPSSLIVQTIAALLLTNWLPGLLLALLLLGQRQTAPNLWNLLLFAAGAGYVSNTLVMLALSYLPGAITAYHTLTAFNVTIILLVTLLWRNQTAPAWSHQLKSSVKWQHLIALLILLGVGGFLRFANLGYAEFVTDEARVILRAAAVLQGNETALFLYRKGPVEILLPATLFSLTGQINETIARLPSALASMWALLSLYRLGWQLWGPLAGWMAAVWMALDGYLIGFARFTQYQSVVLLLTILAVLLLYQLYVTANYATRSFTLLALLVAGGLLAHYDALITLIPIGCLLSAIVWRERHRWRQLASMLAAPIVLGFGLLLAFYLPFVLHDNFQATYTYLVDNRLLGHVNPPFNNLFDIFRRSTVYNSLFFLLWIAVQTLIGMVYLYWRIYGLWISLLLSLIFPTLLTANLLQLDRLSQGTPDITPLLFLIFFGLIWAAPRLDIRQRMLWLWFGLSSFIAFFLIAAPGTHVYVSFVPAYLLLGESTQRGWQFVITKWGYPKASTLQASGVATVLLLFGTYAYWNFVYTKVEVVRVYEYNQPVGHWTPFRQLDIDRLYGFPLANGWKVIGALYAAGELKGDFDTNQRDQLVQGWYTQGQYQCASTATWYFVVDTLEYWAKSSRTAEAEIKAQGYVLWGVVEVKGTPRLRIYQRQGEAAAKIRTFHLEDYIAAFDAQATYQLPLTYPVIEPTVDQVRNINFANQIQLVGYQLEGAAALQPGDTFRLTLYWRAQHTLERSYKVFNQAFYGEGKMVAQKDGWPLCDRLPTTQWYPGELVADVYDVTVAKDAPAGRYPLITGLYDEVLGQRLPVLNAQNEIIDDHVQLGEIQIAHEIRPINTSCFQCK